MASAIPVPGQPGRLWLPGVGVINQYQEGNMKISSFGGLGQMRVALRPELAARVEAMRSGDVVLRQSAAALNPVAQAALQRTIQVDTAGQQPADSAPSAGGFNWKSPMVLGGAAVVALLGGFWWYKRR